MRAAISGERQKRRVVLPHVNISKAEIAHPISYTVNSIVLLTNGITFAIQAVLLLTIGGWADYGTWRCASRFRTQSERRVTIGPCRPNIAIFFTLLAVGVSFAWLGVEDPSQWRTGVALYVLGRGSWDIFCSYCSHLNACTFCSSDRVSGEGHHMVTLLIHLLIRRCLGCPYVLDCRIPWPGSQSPRSSRVR